VRTGRAIFFRLCSPRSANSTETFKPRGDIDAVTENVVALDKDVAEIDPYSKQHSPILRDAGIALGHHRLQRYRAFHRIDHRWKLNQQAITRSFDDTAAMLGDQCVGDSAMFAQDAGGANLVEAHQARIAGHVGHSYRRQPTSDPAGLNFRHTQISSDDSSYDRFVCRANVLCRVCDGIFSDLKVKPTMSDHGGTQNLQVRRPTSEFEGARFLQL
jgi:hypothetical protein